MSSKSSKRRGKILKRIIITEPVKREINSSNERKNFLKGLNEGK